MRLDIRLPIGLLFVTLGILLATFGAFSDPRIYSKSLGYNVNLWWGLVLLAFGLILLALVWRHARRATAAQTPRSG